MREIKVHHDLYFPKHDIISNIVFTNTFKIFNKITVPYDNKLHR